MKQKFTKKEIQDYAKSKGFKGYLPACMGFREELKIWNTYETMQEGYEAFKNSRKSWSKHAENNVKMNNGSNITEMYNNISMDRMPW